MKSINLFATSPETYFPAQQTTALPTKRKFGKKLYIAIAIAAIVVITVAFFIPQGRATIPLNVDYKVGEKMVYDSTMTMSFNLDSTLSLPLDTPSSTNINGQQTIEVMDFDGENYLLNHTITMTLLDKPTSFSVTEKMNKTGYSTYFLDLGSLQQEIPSTGLASNSFLAQLINRPEVNVGDTINVPFPSSNSQYLQTTGNLTMKFGGVEDLTVPAGTYKVFRIEIASNNLKITLNPSVADSSITIPTSLSMSMNLDLNYQVYLEYGTMRQIKSTMQETGTYQSSILNMTAQMGMDMTLNQHIKP